MERSFLCGRPAGTTKLGRALGEMSMAWKVGSAGSRFYGVQAFGLSPAAGSLVDVPRNRSIRSRSSGLI